MQLNISYDSTTLANAPSAFFSAVNYVVNLFDTTFTNDSTVNIEVGYGDFPEDGSPVTSLGLSDQNNVVAGNYSSVRQILVNEHAPGANTLPSVAPINGNLTLGSAQQKALGLVGANTSLDGWVGIASDDELQQMAGASWSFGPTATPGPSEFYIVGVIEHEFSEVMGRTSYLTDPGEYGIIDLYRYLQSGTRQTGAGDPAYFSIDGGNTNLDNFNDPSISSGDLADWAPGPGPHGLINFKAAGPDAFLSESPPGQINGLSSTDLTLMAALGWNATPPRPGNQYVFSAPNQTVNLVSTNDGANLPVAISGRFNVELVTQPVGTSYPLPSGYQAVAILPGGSGLALDVLSGDLSIDDTGSGDTITLGSGAETVTGAKGDTIIGGSGPASVNGHAGPESIIAGGGSTTVSGGVGDTIGGGSGTLSVDGSLGGQQISGGSGVSTIVGGARDTIVGGSGPLTVVGGASGHLNITGGVGGVKAFDLGQRNLVTGGGGPVFIDDSYAGGGLSTLTGGSGTSNFLKGGSGDSLVGGNVGLTGQTIIDAHVGTNETVLGGPGAGTFITGGVGDKIFAGNSVQVFIDASLGSQTVLGSTTNNVVGSSSTDIYFTGAGDSIVGQSGSLGVAGSAAANLTIRGGTGNLDVFNLGTNSSVVGASTGTTFINDAYGAGGTDTLIGGGSATTIIAGANDSVVGKAGALDVRVLSTFAGTTTINLSAAAAVVTDANTNGGSVTGAGGAASVTGFNTSIDTIKTSDSATTLQATETHDGSGNVILNFSDSTSITIIGVTDASAITFTA